MYFGVALLKAQWPEIFSSFIVGAVMVPCAVKTMLQFFHSAIQGVKYRPRQKKNLAARRVDNCYINRSTLSFRASNRVCWVRSRSHSAQMPSFITIYAAQQIYGALLPVLLAKIEGAKRIPHRCLYPAGHLD